jgi:hypothetical protein
MTDVSEIDRWQATLKARCSNQMAAAVNDAARRRGSKPSEWIRQAVLAALRADGVDPVQEQQYALCSHGELVLGLHGPITSFRPQHDDRGTWLPISNVDSGPFDAAKHYRLKPLPLHIDRDRVVREYPIITKDLA